MASGFNYGRMRSSERGKSDVLSGGPLPSWQVKPEDQHAKTPANIIRRPLNLPPMKPIKGSS